MLYLTFFTRIQNNILLYTVLQTLTYSFLSLQKQNSARIEEVKAVYIPIIIDEITYSETKLKNFIEEEVSAEYSSDNF